MRFLILLPALLCLIGCRSGLEAESPEPGSQAKARVLAYLQAQQGKTILAGQMDLTWHSFTDMAARVKKTTGREPALMGYDFMNFTDKGIRKDDADFQVTEALDWWNRGGLVTFCWHWRDPTGATSSFYRTGSSSGGAGTGLHIPLKNGAFDPTTALGQAMTVDIDHIGAQLVRLRDAGVAVLWRPLHEGGGNGTAGGSGAWFWWGQDGAAAYNALYRYLYERLTKVHGLNNLIWVWNGQGEAFYPGDDVVEVGGQDVYEKHHGSQKSWYQTLRTWTSGKLVALTEVGALPDPDLIPSDGAWFSWFLVWNDNPQVNLAKANDNFWSGSGSTTEDSVNYPWNTPTLEKRVYGHEKVITLDELRF